MISTTWWMWDGGATQRTGPWAHPIHLNANNAVRANASMGRVTANADLPRILLDGDTDIETPTDNERIEVEG